MTSVGVTKQMQNIRWGTLAGLLLASTVAHADPIVNLAHYYVAKDSTQSVAIGVTDAASAAADDIEGMTFTLQIAAGTGSTPAINAIDFLTSSIWTGHVSPDLVINAAGGNAPQFKSFTLTTNSEGEFVNANGTLATVGFSAAGATPGDYVLKLVGTNDPGNDSRFGSGLGNSVPATFGNGTLTVVAAGDFTRDNHVNAADIAAMMTALTDLNAYKTAKSLDNAGLVAIGDLNGDHQVTNADLQGLLTLLKSGGGSMAAVPEPAGWMLAVPGAIFLMLVFRRIDFRWNRIA
jgi:hypothetical protein